MRGGPLRSASRAVKAGAAPSGPARAARFLHTLQSRKPPRLNWPSIELGHGMNRRQYPVRQNVTRAPRPATECLQCLTSSTTWRRCASSASRHVPSRRWVVWVIAFVVCAAAGYAGWRWATRERPDRGGNCRRRRTDGGHAGRRAQRVGLRDGAPPRDGVIEDHGQDRRSERRGRHGGPRGPDPRAARRRHAAERRWRWPRPRRGGGAARRCARSEVRLAEAQARRSAARTSSSRKDWRRVAEVDAAQAEVDSLDARILAAREQVRVAERQVELERTNLDDTIIRAPFSGVAISKDAQPGEMVSPVSAGGGFTRTGICTLVDMRSLEIEVDVNESYINRVRTDQDVTRRARRLSGLADPGARDHDGADRRPPEGDGARAHRIRALDPRILPDMGVKVTFLRDAGDEPRRRWRGRWRSCRRQPSRPTGDQSYAFVVSGRRRRSARREDRRHRRRSARGAGRPQRRRARGRLTAADVDERRAGFDE